MMTRNRKRKRFRDLSDEDDEEDNKRKVKVPKAKKDSDSDYNPESDEYSDNNNSSEYDSEEDDSFLVPDTLIEYEDGTIVETTHPSRLSLGDKDDRENFSKLMDQFNKKDINEIDILNSTLSEQAKLDAYEMLRIQRAIFRLYGENHEWMELRNSLYKKVKKSEPFTPEDQKELDRINNILKSEETLEQKILRSNQPDDVKIKIYQRYQQIKNLAEDDDTRVKYQEWIETCLNLPTEVIELTTLYKNCTDMLTTVKSNFDEDLFGQILVKERVLEVLTAMWTNPNRSRNCMVFLGDPGVGKTAFARTLAKSIGLPFYQISFGGAKDSAILKGHGFTYIGSKPGEIVEALVNMGVKNGILYLDELDKIKDTLHGQEVINSLLHILDYTQNVEFKDNYLHGIPIDLSKLIIIISINSLEVINNVLADRLPVVSFQNYTDEDKIEIGTQFLIPRIINNLNMNPSNVKYDKSSVAYILSKSRVKESGVRQFERNISTIFERINVLIQLYKDKSNRKIKMSYDIPRFKLPLKLDRKIIDILFEEYLF